MWSSFSLAVEHEFKSDDLIIIVFIESGITAAGFSQLDKEDFEDLGLTKIGKKLILKILPESK